MPVKKWFLGLLMSGLISLPVGSFAAEHGGQEQEGAAPAPAGSQEHGGSSAVTPAESEPAAPAAPEPAPVAPPALKPITITFSGDLSIVNMTDTPPMITVQDRYGVKKEISVPAEAKVSQGGASKALTDLKAGDKLTVEYTYDVATGKRTAQSISIGESSPATP